jgi:hypothetical protein
MFWGGVVEQEVAAQATEKERLLDVFLAEIGVGWLVWGLGPSPLSAHNMAR